MGQVIEAAFSKLGVLLSKMNEAYEQGNPNGALPFLGEAGKALAELRVTVLNALGPTPTPYPELEPIWTGSIDPFKLTPIDLAFWQHWCYPAIAGKVFGFPHQSGELSKANYNAWIRRDYEASKALSPSQTANYTGVLAQFKGKQVSDF